MRLLAIDPSLTCTGWAVMESADSVIAHGTATPKAGPIQDRIDELCADLEQLAIGHLVGAVVIETPAMNMRGGRDRAVTSGAAYGFCAGQVFRALKAEGVQRGFTVYGTSATDWTKSLGSAVRRTRGDTYKLNRVRAVEYMIPSLKGGLGVKSKAGNVADAILIGRWWFQRYETDRRIA